MAIKPFNYQQDFSCIDFRQHSELYQVGRGEQGVLLVEPYKSEILPYWRYKDEASATESARKFISSSSFIDSRMISLVWIWHENLFRWATPGQGVMPITKVVKNMQRMAA